MEKEWMRKSYLNKLLQTSGNTAYKLTKVKLNILS